MGEPPFLIGFFVVSTRPRRATIGQKGKRRMQWYNYLGWMLVGIFILFFGIGMFAGIDES